MFTYTQKTTFCVTTFVVLSVVCVCSEIKNNSRVKLINSYKKTNIYAEFFEHDGDIYVDNAKRNTEKGIMVKRSAQSHMPYMFGYGPRHPSGQGQEQIQPAVWDSTNFGWGILPEAEYCITLPSPKGQEMEFYYVSQLPNGLVVNIKFDVHHQLNPFPELIKGTSSLEVDRTQQQDTIFTDYLTVKKVRNENARLKKIIKSCRAAKSLKLRKVQLLNVNHSRRVSDLQKKVQMIKLQLQTEIAKSKDQIKSVKRDTEQKLATIFSPAQVRVIFNKQKKALWAEVDIAKAIAFRAKSNRAYNFARDVLKIPLPGVSTLQRYCNRIDLRPGVLHSVLNLLKEEFKDCSEVKRQAILSFDEMAIDSSACYDYNEDKVYGQQENLTVVVIRGLFSSWKQIVYYDYQLVNVEAIMKIISACHEIGIIVRAFVCDLGGKNRGLLNSLGISIKKTYITHPVTSKKIWCFADVPHLLKLLRNHILDSGLILLLKIIIKKLHFEKFLRADSGEFRMQHKLTDYHLNLKGRERQRVLPACQLLSCRTSKAYRQIFPEESEIADFIQLINDSFDVLNSRDIEEKCPFKAPYGLYLEAQDKKLDELYKEISNLRVIGKNYLLPFQKGFMITITSVKELFLEMNKKFRMRYILTHRLNQDVTENAFSVIRSIGGTNDSPNAVDVKYRLRYLLLGWTFNNVKAAPVHIENQSEHFVSCKLLSPLLQNTNVRDTEVDTTIFNDIDCSDLINPISNSNWSQTITAMSLTEQCNFYGTEYVAGYICSKLKDVTTDFILKDTDRIPASFTQNISRGRLTIPTYDFMAMFSKFEDIFLHLFRKNGDKFGLYRGENVMRTLKEQLVAKYPSIPLKLINLYVTTRIHIRIKHVNQQLKAKKDQRKSKVFHYLRSRVQAQISIANEAEMRAEWNEIFGSSS